MKKILIINGHPSEDGLSFFISDSYVSGAKKSGAQVKVLNLKDIKFNPILKTYKDKLESDLIKSQKFIRRTRLCCKRRLLKLRTESLFLL